MANSSNTDPLINALQHIICREVNWLTFNLKIELEDSITFAKIIGIKQNFPAGSYHGGIWERIIRIVQKILSSVLQRLDEDGLHTIVCEVEPILKEGPITKLSDDPNNLTPLTPNHILLIKGSVTAHALACYCDALTSCFLFFPLTLATTSSLLFLSDCSVLHLFSTSLLLPPLCPCYLHVSFVCQFGSPLLNSPIFCSPCI